VILLEWSEFAQRFARELAGLDRDTILIVRERDESRHYVQAMREPDRLYAEAVSNNFLAGSLLLTLADEEVLSETGWRPPTTDWSPANWWTELPPDTGAVDFDRLADMMVTALRDVQGVRRPSDLVYESFHRHGTGLIELVDFGIDSADPQRVSERRTAQVAEEPIPAPTGAQYGEGREPRPVAELETRLDDAKQRGDQFAYFELLLGADLVLPSTGHAVEDPGLTEFTTAVIEHRRHVLVFTSVQAMTRSQGTPGRRTGTGLYRKTTFGKIAAAWPDPSWGLAVNPGLPSETHLDSLTVARLDEMRRTAERAATVDAVVTDSPADLFVRLPHGAQLWWLGESGPASPMAVYDAMSARWSTSVADAQAPRNE
jgi:T3SS (YopN, CesT) and YbjN peptide-binding chaperone 3/SseB protein N-terminal domain